MSPGTVRPAGVELKLVPSNNGMHPTRASMNLIVSLDRFEGECGRVMPGVMLLP